MSKNNNKKNNRNYENNNSRGKFSKGNERGYRDREERAQNSSKVNSKYGNSYCGSENDPSWYNKLQTLIKDVTRIPFAYQVGRALDYRDAVGASWTDDSGDHEELVYGKSTPPGVMALEYIPIPGIAKSATDGVNIAATGIFQNMRKELSTIAQYASADVMMYILACDSILTLYNVILRNFGMINLYSSVNYNYNRSLYKAQGWQETDLADFYSNFSNFRTRFNNLIYKASTIYMPNTISIMDRHAWLFSNIFIDSVSPKAQNYLHVCKGIWKLDETTSTEGTSMNFIELVSSRPTNGSKMTQLLDVFDELIETMRNSDSMNKIAADMRRAFPNISSWQLAYCDEQYSVSPTYSKEVLSQIENTTILDYQYVTGLTIEQSVNKNIILFNPTITTTKANEIGYVNYNAWTNDQLINMHWDNPSSDDIAVATRNMINLEKKAGTGPLQVYHIDSAGSDICVGARIIKHGIDNYSIDFDTTIHRFMGILSVQTAAQQGTEIYLTPDSLTDYTSFDWAPMIYIGYAMPTTVTTAIPTLYGCRALTDYDNYTLISPQALKNIHTNVIASMWNVPQLGDVQL